MTNDEHIQRLKDIEAIGLLLVSLTVKVRLTLEIIEDKKIKKTVLSDHLKAKLRGKVYKTHFNRKVEAA